MIGERARAKDIIILKLILVRWREQLAFSEHDYCGRRCRARPICPQ